MVTLLGEQVEQPLQFGGAGAQVGCQLRPGLCPVAAQRIEQLAVIVCGMACRTASATCSVVLSRWMVTPRPVIGLAMITILPAPHPGQHGARRPGGL